MALAINNVSGGVTTQAPVAHAFGGLFIVRGMLTITGSYTTGGDPLDFTSILNQQGVGVADYVNVDDVLGYILNYDSVNKKLLFYTAPNTELTAAAYPGGLLAATPHFVVIGR